MAKKLSFIEEAEFNGFQYRPNGILGNGFYGNGHFITLSDMEKINKTANHAALNREDEMKIDTDLFIRVENQEHFITKDILDLFMELKEHQLHNFLNKYKDVFMSQKLFKIVNNKRIFSKEAIKFIYNKLIKKEEPQPKRRGRGSNQV
jgi:hypothetical protein